LEDLIVNLEKLKSIGFKHIGTYPTNFGFDGEDIPKYKKDYLSCLYALVVKEEIKYIGYTSQPIKKRLGNHIKIQEHNDCVIDCYIGIFDEKPFMVDFYIDTAQGLEWSLIEYFDPEWNDDKPSEHKRGLEKI